jgi:hypothetical protein
MLDTTTGKDNGEALVKSIVDFLYRAIFSEDRKKSKIFF